MVNGPKLTWTMVELWPSPAKLDPFFSLKTLLIARILYPSTNIDVDIS